MSSRPRARRSRRAGALALAQPALAGGVREPAPPPGEARLRVLLVGNDPGRLADVARALGDRTLIEVAGFDRRGAPDAEAVVEKGAHDIVVSLISEPDAVRRLRRRRPDPGLVVMCSSDDAIEIALAAGADEAVDSRHPGRLTATIGRWAAMVRETAARRSAENALRESETRFAAFMNNSPTVAFLKDEDGRYVYVNEPFQRSFGVDAAGWSDRTDFDLWPSEVASALHRGDQAAMRGDAGQTFERIPDAAGRIRTWMYFRFPVTEASGRPLLGAMGLDVTDLKHAETALQATQERLERVLSSSPTVLYALAVDGDSFALTWVSRNIPTLLGYGVEEALEPSWWNQHIHDDDRAEAEGALPELFASNQLTHEYRLRHQDGTFLWIRDDSRLRRDPFGAPVEVFGSWADITERRHAEDVLERAKAELEARVSERTSELREAYQRLQVELVERRRAEEASRQSEERLALVAQATNDAIWDLNLLTDQIWWNQGVQTLFGYADSEVRPDFAWWLEQLHQGDRVRVRESLTAVFEGDGAGWTAEYRFHRADGRYATVLDRGHVLRDETGKAVRMIGSMLDITDRKQTEEKLSDANDMLTAQVAELEQRNREMQLLGDLGELLQTCTAMDEAYEVISHSAQQLFRGESGALYVFRGTRNVLEAAATWGGSPPEEQGFEASECWALRRGRVHIVDGDSSSLHCQHARKTDSGYLCLPMMAQSEALGLLHLTTGDMREGRRRFAQTVAENLALGMANLRLREQLRAQAIRDPLTGLYNRRFMEEALERELRRAQRRTTPLSVIMIDIDHFKRLNDTMGHEAGDAMLRELGLFLQNNVRAGDVACRYGGEEITLILPDANLADAVHRAETLRAGVKAMSVQDRGRTIGPVTISMGVGSFPDHANTTDALLRVADQALYKAKEEGRDRVKVAGSLQ